MSEHPDRLMAPTPSMEWDNNDPHRYIAMVRRMKIAAALIAWCITIFGGAALITVWLVRQSQ